MKKGNSDLVDISGEVRHETEKAYLFYDGKDQAWMPKSLCQWDDLNKIMTCPEWIALEKGLI
jgi:hypothetical protein